MKSAVRAFVGGGIAVMALSRCAEAQTGLGLDMGSGFSQPVQPNAAASFIRASAAYGMRSGSVLMSYEGGTRQLLARGEWSSRPIGALMVIGGLGFARQKESEVYDAPKAEI